MFVTYAGVPCCLDTDIPVLMDDKMFASANHAVQGPYNAPQEAPASRSTLKPARLQSRQWLFQGRSWRLAHMGGEAGDRPKGKLSKRLEILGHGRPRQIDEDVPPKPLTKLPSRCWAGTHRYHGQATLQHARKR